MRAVVLVFVLSTLFLTPPSSASVVEGIEPLGIGRGGQAFVLEGDLVVENVGDLLVRDYGASGGPVWRDRAPNSESRLRDLLVGPDLVVALPEDTDLGIVRIFRRDTPTTLQPVGSFDPGATTSGFLLGDVVVLATESFVAAYDASDPSTPAFGQFISSTPRLAPRHFTRDGDVLYFVDDGNTVARLDVEDPASIVIESPFTVSGDAIDGMVAADGVLHLLVRTDAPTLQLDLVTLDLSGAGAPVESARATVLTGDGAQGVDLDLQGDLLLAVGADGRVHAFDRAIPTAPVAGWTLDANAIAVTATATRLFVETADALEEYALPNPSVPPADDYRRPKDLDLSMLLGEGPVHLGMRDSDRSQFAVVDLTDPLRPVRGDWIELDVSGLPVRGDDYALLLGFPLTVAYDARVIDLADPRSPVVGDAVELPRAGEPAGVDAGPRAVLTDDTAWVSFPEEFGDAVRAVDIRDRAQPVEISLSTPIEGPVLAAGGDVLITSAAGGLEVYDVSMPSTPQQVAYFGLPVALRDAVLIEGYLYGLAPPVAGSSPIYVVDLTDPASPGFGDIVSTDVPFAATAIGEAAGGFHVRDDARLAVFGTSDPGRPVVRARLEGTGAIVDVAAAGELLVTLPELQTYEDRGAVVSAELPTARVVDIEMADPMPNPFNPSTSVAFTLDRAADLKVVVHDLRGRRVAVLADERFAAARHRLTWDGRDVAGRAVASGVYVFRVFGDGIDVSRSATLVK